jgi:hypothetical protein
VVLPQFMLSHHSHVSYETAAHSQLLGFCLFCTSL